MTERVLVTGGTGYIAGWCIAELLQRGYEVRTTVRSAEKGDIARAAVATVVDPHNGLSIATADLTSDGEWDTAVSRVDHVLHVAGPLGNEHSTDPDELIVPARDGAAPGPPSGDRGPRRASCDHVGGERRQPVVLRRRGDHRRVPVDRSERPDTHPLPKVQDACVEGDLGVYDRPPGPGHPAPHTAGPRV